jgi:hypothetical protein
LSIAIDMFGVDVGSIPCGFGASTTAQGLHLVASSAFLGFQRASRQILIIGMMQDPFHYSLHLDAVKQL